MGGDCSCQGLGIIAVSRDFTEPDIHRFKARLSFIYCYPLPRNIQLDSYFFVQVFLCRLLRCRSFYWAARGDGVREDYVTGRSRIRIEGRYLYSDKEGWTPLWRPVLPPYVQSQFPRLLVFQEAVQLRTIENM
jgi:hypothetical protein